MDRLLKKYASTNNLFLLVNLLLLICFFCQLERIGTGNYFNSDSLYLPSIYRDIFVDGNSFKSWHLNGAPNFFPDMLVYFVIIFFSGGNLIIASFIFSLVQFFFILFLFVKIFKAILPGRSARFYSIIYLFQSLWLLEVFYFSGNFIFVYFLLSNSYHTGSFVMTLCSFLIVIDFLKSPTKLKLLALFVLVLLSAFSDRLFILLFFVPLIFSCLFFFRKRFWPMVQLVLFCGGACWLSTWLYDAINATNYIYFFEPDLHLSVERTTAAYNLFFHLAKEYTFDFGYRSICIYLFVVSIGGLIFILATKRKKIDGILKFFVLFTLSQSMVVLFAPVVIGNFTGYDCLRYNIYPLYLTGLNLAVVFAVGFRFPAKVKLLSAYITLILAFFMLISGFANFNYRGLQNFFSYYPETAKRLDEVAEKHGLLNGVANFWYAKSTSMFSKRGIRVVAVYDGLFPYLPITNENWFFNQNNKFNFVLLNNFTDTSQYKGKLLQYDKLYDEEKFKLVKTNEFTFDRNSGMMKNTIK